MAKLGYNDSVEDVRKEEYPMMRGSVYLDHAGTTPYAKSLIDSFARDMTSNLYGNPHSASASSQSSTCRIENVRLRVLQFFNADPAEFDVVFVANATAGVKLIVDGLRTIAGGFDYAYHEASHTSLVGVREEARRSVCIDNSQVRAWIDGQPVFAEDGSDTTTLFAYAGQSNLNGERFPLDWARQVRVQRANRSKRTLTLLDAAALVATSPFDLGCAAAAPDFVVLSFYKIFGFPHLGALIVRREAQDVFDSRRYFGGGTVEMVVCLKEQWHASKAGFLHDRLEDGTLPIHMIIALDAALDTHARLFRSMASIAAHTRFLWQELYRGLTALRHGNGEQVCMLYLPEAGEQAGEQEVGPVLAFNLLDQHGTWVSLVEFEKLATAKRFHVRTGGVCNPGGIARALDLQAWEMRRHFSAGFRCGSDKETMGGKPTGVVRASLGAMSTMEDVASFVAFVTDFYRHENAILDRPDLGSLPDPSPALYVHSLTIYPIKSCAGFPIRQGLDWEVRPEGLAWDREWCLMHRGTGRALNQKVYPRMALIRPTLDLARGELRVGYAGDTPAHLPREIVVPLSDKPGMFPHRNHARPLHSRVCGESIVVQTYTADHVNHFFSDILAVPCSLARFPPGGLGPSKREVKADMQKHQKAERSASPGSSGALPPPPGSGLQLEKTQILLANESPVSAIALASLQALNREIGHRGGHAVSATVFRANVVIGTRKESEPAPYAEDGWGRLRVGRLVFDLLGSCRRCHMVCINQDTAEKGEEPFVTLSKTRRFDGNVFFGLHLAYITHPTSSTPTQGRTIRVGDIVWPDVD